MVNKKYTCVVCKRIENDQNKMFICKYCFSASHSKCYDKPPNINNSMHNDYLCSAKCIENYNRIATTLNLNNKPISLLGAELKTAILTETQTMKESVRSVTSAIEKSQEFLASKFDFILEEFKTLKLENEQLRKELQSMKNNQLSLKNVVQKLEDE